MSDYLFLKLDNITSCNSAFLRKDFGRRLRYAHSPEIIEGFLLKCMQNYYKNAGIYANNHYFQKQRCCYHKPSQCPLVSELSEGIDLSYRIDKSLSFLKIMLALLAYVHFL